MKHPVLLIAGLALAIVGVNAAQRLQARESVGKRTTLSLEVKDRMIAIEGLHSDKDVRFAIDLSR